MNALVNLLKGCGSYRIFEIHVELDMGSAFSTLLELADRVDSRHRPVDLLEVFLGEVIITRVVESEEPSARLHVFYSQANRLFKYGSIYIL